MILLRALVLMLTALSLAACNLGAPNYSVEYSYSYLDLCGATDLSPLAPLKLKLDSSKSDQSVQSDEFAERCYFEMRTAEGNVARLVVAAAMPYGSGKIIQYPSKFPREWFVEEKSAAVRDGDLDGPWLESATYAWERPMQSLMESNYLAHGYTKHVYVRVSIRVVGASAIPKEELVRPVMMMVENTYALASSTWKLASPQPLP